MERATAGRVDWNNRRPRSGVGMITPTEHERARYAAISSQVQPS